MRRLGAVIAGGRSSRFGTDKAVAMLDGRALLDHVAYHLDATCESVVICGRAWGDRPSIDDRPAPGLGPLGGLCAALHYGLMHGFDVVVTAGCDTLPVPVIPVRGEGPVVVAGHYLFGEWPVALAVQLDAHLGSTDDRSMRLWMRVAAVRQVPVAASLHNFNTQAELRRYTETRRLAA